ncbi:MAG: pentapeptide repeat-containing protein [Pseudomonadota bacterium]
MLKAREHLGAQFQDLASSSEDWQDLYFEDCTFFHCYFSGAKIFGCHFLSCRFGNCDFTQSDLSESDFRGAQNYQLNPAENKIKGARFSLPKALQLLTELGIHIG